MSSTGLTRPDVEEHTSWWLDMRGNEPAGERQTFNILCPSFKLPIIPHEVCHDSHAEDVMLKVCCHRDLVEQLRGKHGQTAEQHLPRGIRGNAVECLVSAPARV